MTRGFWTIVIAHTMFCLSFVALTVKARIRGLDWSLEDAAADLGSPPLRTFCKITFPLIIPGVVAAFLLSLALSIDDYIITSFIAGSVSTFPRRDLRLGEGRDPAAGPRAGDDDHGGRHRDPRARHAGGQPPPAIAPA